MASFASVGSDFGSDEWDLADYDPNEALDEQRSRALERYSGNELLGSEALLTYLQLLTPDQERAKVVTDLMLMATGVNLSKPDTVALVQRQQTPLTERMLVPVILENNFKKNQLVRYFDSKFSFLRDHIVLVGVDLTDRSLFYFDSQGVDGEREDRFIVGTKNVKVGSFLREMRRAFFPDDGEQNRIVSNRVKHQSDGVNCGVYVGQIIHNLLTAENIHQCMEEEMADIWDIRRQQAERIQEQIS